MDNLLALGLFITLLLRGVPFVLAWMSPQLRRLLNNHMARMLALLDIGGGTLMAGLVVLLLWEKHWIAASLLALISIPTWTALFAGFRTLARTSR